MVGAVIRELQHIEGVTLSGGEPLEQPVAVADFCAELKARSELGIIVLTGFTRAEIERDPVKLTAVADVDMVIAGRYNAARHIGTGLRGSANKVYWALTGRYQSADFMGVPEAEVVIGQDGTVMVTGMIEMRATPR
jgi:anaerobic ribonucleoside-triphosphate reductase activating protein